MYDCIQKYVGENLPLKSKEIIMQYIHGGDIYKYKEYNQILDFSTNINPFGPSERVIAAATAAIQEISRYPDNQCRSLVQALSEQLNLSQSFILCGNGAADLIFSLVLAEKPKKALITAPTFSEYEQALHTVGCQIQYAYLYTNKQFELDEEFLTYLTADLDILFLCSPNNPTGKKVSKELLQKILKKCEENEIRFVLDECFYEFLENPQRTTMQAEIVHHPQLVVLRAFTKMHAIPGLRLGYLLCSDFSLLEHIRMVRQPWSVSNIAQSAGIAALQDRVRVSYVRQYIIEERRRMEQELEQLGISYTPSDANYILLYREEKEKDSLYEGLLRQHILIRDCQNYVGLKKGYYRIAIKKKEENNRLLSVLQKEVTAWQSQL